MAKSKPTAAVAQSVASAFDIVSSMPGFMKPLQDAGGSSTYVQFVHPNAKNYQTIMESPGCKGAPTGTPVLIRPEAPPTRLGLFEFVMLPIFRQFYADVDGQGIPIKAYEDMVGQAKEIIEAAILVLHNEEFIPATIRCQGPKTPGIKAAVKVSITNEHQAATCTLAEWAQMSKDHKIITQMKGLPSWAWAVHTATMTTTTPRARPGSQATPYQTMVTQDRPMSIMEGKTLMELQKNAEFVDALSKVRDSVAKRVEEIEKLM